MRRGLFGECYLCCQVATVKSLKTIGGRPDRKATEVVSEFGLEFSVCSETTG